MRKRIVSMLLIVAVFPTAIYAHQFYISITTIQHHPETQKLTVRIKLYVNDLEESILQKQGVRLGLWANKPIENAESYVEQYVLSKVLISINDAPISLKLINQTVESAEVLEDNVLLCQLEAYDISEIAKIKIHNSLLTETIDSQVNIVNLRVNGTKKVINLDGKLPEDQVVFH